MLTYKPINLNKKYLFCGWALNHIWVISLLIRGFIYSFVLFQNSSRPIFKLMQILCYCCPFVSLVFFFRYKTQHRILFICWRLYTSNTMALLIPEKIRDKPQHKLCSFYSLVSVFMYLLNAKSGFMWNIQKFLTLL